MASGKAPHGDGRRDGDADRVGAGAELFDELGTELAASTGAELGTGWHHPAVKARGKIAAMLNAGDLVVKVELTDQPE